MRTKTVLMTAVLGAASLATAMAQTVYSVNAVGYVNVPVPAGKFALLANPLDTGTNATIAAVLPDVPIGTVVYTYGTAGFADATKRTATVWSGPGSAALLKPGVGFFIKNAGTADLNITFVGEVMQGDATKLKVDYVAGFNLLGSLVPQEGKVVTDLKLGVQNNDTIYTFDPATQTYGTFTKRTDTVYGR